MWFPIEIIADRPEEVVEIGEMVSYFFGDVHRFLRHGNRMVSGVGKLFRGADRMVSGIGKLLQKCIRALHGRDGSCKLFGLLTHVLQPVFHKRHIL